jgi:crotonobetainyl-CoA:carnitine CoA-transferase CaiB-like acyl-CoA transferase
MNDNIFDGIRVLDFTDFLAGPLCGMYLADFGAEVIKVENLRSGGNFVRNAMPREPKTNRSMYFQNLNRGKKAVAIDLKNEDGKKMFAELIKSADVLVENNRPGVMERLGFGWETVHELNPNLIMCSVSGYGQTGTGRRKPGYDLIAQAMGGSMSITGWPGMEPTRAGMAIGDLMGGLNAMIAVASCLFKRERGGGGQYVDVSLVDCIVSGLEAKMMEYLYTGVSPTMTGNRYITSAPYDSFKAKDGYFVIASGTDKHFEKLSAAMGMPDLPKDPRFCGTQERRKNHAPLKEIIQEWTADKTCAECIKIIDEAGVPTGPIYNCEQIAKDENIAVTRQMLVKVHHPEAGDLTVLGNPLKFSTYKPEYDKAAPDLGENNEEIFKGLGFTDEQIAKAREDGAIN